MTTSIVANKIKPSTTLAIAAQANSMRKQGFDVINFSAGEPDFNTPEFIIKAAITAMENGQTRYTPAAGTLELRQTIAARIKTDLDITYAAEEIIVSSGAKQSIAIALQALINPGDEVIIPAPYWLSYPAMVKVLNGSPQVIQTTSANNWKITAEQLAAKITNKTKVIMLNSPSNPTGAVYTATELKALGEVIKNHPEIIVISDDIYEKIYWGKEPFANLITVCPELKNQCLIINGTSKAYAMTGWRIGYTAGSPTIIKAMSKIQSHTSGCACSISQAAAQAAFADDQAELKQNAKMFAKRYELTISAINSIKNLNCSTADGAFYCLIDATQLMQEKNITSDLDLAQELLNECHIAVVPGSVFGIENHFRISFALDEASLTQGLDRLKKYCD